MIILDSATKSVEVLLAGAVAANQLPCVASFVDVTVLTYTPGATDTQTNDGAAVTFVAAPVVAATARQVKLLTVYNADTVPTVVTVRLNDSGTMRILVKPTLPVSATLVYTDGEGFRVIDSGGAIIGVGTTGATGAAGTPGARGIPGVDGDMGIDGDQGFPGPAGAPGAAGAAGVMGPMGFMGVPGQDGEEGLEGLRGGPGAVGATGSTGPAGPFTPGPPGQDADDPEMPWMIPGPSGAGSGGTPGGSNTQVQFNDSSAFGGDGGLTYNKTTDILSLGSGLAFPATQVPVTDANTLDDYEEMAVTPTDGSGASLTFTNVAGQGIKIGRLVVVWGNITYPTTASGAVASIGGMPYTTGAAAQGEFGGFVSFSNFGATLRIQMSGSQTVFSFYSGVSGSQITNAQLSGLTVTFCVLYRAAT